MLNFIENFLFKIDLKVVSIMKRKSVISLILRVGLLDHLCKEELKCKFYYRYADDIIEKKMSNLKHNIL